MKITVWDDDTGAAIRWKGNIDGLLSNPEVLVEAPSKGVIDTELQILHERRKRYIADGDMDTNTGSRLDDTDILVVDNDLFELGTFKDLSAEVVAMRACTYTSCAYIVVLNVNPDIDFDLSLLGYPDSKADLHINDQFIAQDGLWLKCPREEGAFRPWCWPLLLTAAKLQKARVDELTEFLATEENQNTAILDYFSFGEAARNRLSRSAKAFLHPAIPARDVNFLQFVRGNAKAVGIKDGEQMWARRDTEMIARVCARRIAKWLTHFVLGSQDVLIDLPHLVAQLPFLVPSDRRVSEDFWNSLAVPEGAAIKELAEDVDAARFVRGEWFDRPVFWWDEFDTEENFEKLISAGAVNEGGLVFCEDASSFHPVDLCRRFVAAFQSTSDNRFVRWFDVENPNYNYSPQSRFAR